MRQVITTTGVLTIIALASWLSWSCKEDTTQTETNVIVFPDSNVSYLRHVQPYFDRGCGGQSSQCHGAETFDQHGGFSLDSYEDATHRIDIIVPGAPEASLLVKRMEGSAQPKMPPPNFPPPNSNQLNGIKRWIKEGAQNN